MARAWPVGAEPVGSPVPGEMPDRPATGEPSGRRPKPTGPPLATRQPGANARPRNDRPSADTRPIRPLTTRQAQTKLRPRHHWQRTRPAPSSTGLPLGTHASQANARHATTASTPLPRQRQPRQRRQHTAPTPTPATPTLAAHPSHAKLDRPTAGNWPVLNQTPASPPSAARRCGPALGWSAAGDTPVRSGDRVPGRAAVGAPGIPAAAGRVVVEVRSAALGGLQ